MFRGPVRRAFRRGIRRERRWLRRRARRIARGGWILLMLAGTTAAIKIRADDARRIEAAYHKPPEAMSEQELNSAMQKLNVKKQDLDEEDEGYVDTADEQDEQSSGVRAAVGGAAKFCRECGTPLSADAKYCEKCGKKL